MIINPVCPNCGKELTVNIKKIDRLETEVNFLKSDNLRLWEFLLMYIMLFSVVFGDEA